MESPERTTYQHYEVERLPGGALHELGRGAMGITYKALDSNLRVPVALKVITGALLPDARARARFMREARAAAQLRHSNVATVYYLGQEADFCFYTMEFVDGETCEARVRREGPLDPVTALRICSQAARALQAAHSRGLLHRDLKPSNLMVAQEGGDLLVKVIDFGLVKPLQPDDADAGAASLSGGLFLGTPLYASPEQCASEETIDGRSDLYSLGATLWFLLRGEPLFKGTMRSVMVQHLTKPPPLEILASQPPLLAGLLRSLLAKDPAERPVDAVALRVRIAEALRELETRDAAPAALAAALPPPPGSESAPGVDATALTASFALEEVLRKRGSLPPDEVVFLLPHLAALLESVPPGRPLPDLSPHNVRAYFSTVAAESGAAAIVGLPPADWPPFVLEIAAPPSSATVAPAPADGTLIQSSPHTPATPVESLARLVYELLNGSPLPGGRSYRPITVLTEEGNHALRRALPSGPSPGYAGVADFRAALTHALAGGGTTAIRHSALVAATEDTLLAVDNPPSASGRNTALEGTLPENAVPSSAADAAARWDSPPASKSIQRSTGHTLLSRLGASVGVIAAVLIVGSGVFSGWKGATRQPAKPAAATAPAVPVPRRPVVPAMPSPMIPPGSLPTAPARLRLTAQNIARVQSGMASSEVEAIFGPPDAVENTVERRNARFARKMDAMYTEGDHSLEVIYIDEKVVEKHSSVDPGSDFTDSRPIPTEPIAATPATDSLPTPTPPPPVRRRPPPPTPSPEPPAKSPKRPVAASDSATPAKPAPGKSGMREQQRKAIEQQHKNGQLSDADYQQALRGLGR